MALTYQDARTMNHEEVAARIEEEAARMEAATGAQEHKDALDYRLEIEAGLNWQALQEFPSYVERFRKQA